MLSSDKSKALFTLLKERFAVNKHRHEAIDWPEVAECLAANQEKIWSLNEMERTGGKPDVVGKDEITGEFFFFDCSSESPDGLRSLCYDREALESRNANEPQGTAVDMAAMMHIELLTESQYFELQQFGEFDTKTSSWLKTPHEIRNLGGAILGDRRYGRVFYLS